MSDESIAAKIESLVADEHDLRRREEADSGDADRLEADQERLRAVEVELDRCWDLLRQRRAREEFAQNPDDAAPTANRHWVFRRPARLDRGSSSGRDRELAGLISPPPRHGRERSANCE